MSELAYLSATEALRRFRDRSLSPVELLDALRARIDEVEETVNALPTRFLEEARAAAEAAEARYAGKGPGPRPLEGIPLAVKEETPVRGQPWTMGSLCFKDQVADHTAVCVQRLLDAGAIVHARSAAPEFSCAPFTHSRLWGVTRNPWNPEYSAGGSSGGSAAALAAGMTTLATGSDIGGSIRIPASMCGVVGFKPPYGRVPEEPPFNLDHYCHEGPLARTVADCALMENVIAGPHPSDVASLRPKLTLPEDFDGVDGLRVGLSVNLGNYPVEEDVAANTRAAAEALREAGAVVEEVELGWDRRTIRRAADIHFGLIFAAWVSEVLAEHRDEMTAYAVRFAEESRSVRGEDWLTGLELEAEIYSHLGDVLERYDLLVCPTFAVPALEAGEDYVERTPQVNGEPTEHLLDVLMTLPFNICSRCPVMSVPSGFARTGVPTGVQLVGRTYDDVTVFRAAAALECIRPWLESGERRPALAGRAALI